MFWSMKRTRSRNAIFNFIVGNRGAGKTFGYLDFCIERFLKTMSRRVPERFIYSRRTKAELKPLALAKPGGLFDKVGLVKYGDHKLQADSGVLRIDGELAGWAVAVSEMPKSKSRDFPGCRYMCLDEFIIDSGVGNTYIRGEAEPEILLDFYQTVDRDEDRLSMWFLANSITENNPYFNYFGLRMPEPNRFGIYQDGSIIVENVADPELIERKQGTRFGKMVSGSKYADYAINNKMLRDSKAFIKHKPDTAAYRFALIYMDNKLGVWYDTRNGYYYISPDFLKDNPVQYCVTTEDHQPNLMLARAARKSPFLVNLENAYEMGRVYYENQKIANWFRDIVRLI